MKKILLTAVAALAIVGCSQNEEIEKAGEKAEINFGSIVKGSTRAAVTTTSNFKEFTVSGYKTADAMSTGIQLATGFIDDLLVENSESTGWGYTGTFYWPITGKVQFFATSPKQSLDLSAKGYPTFSYTIKSVTSQEDLVAANLIDQVKTSGDITLTFQHLLTQVNFSIKGDTPDFTYAVTKLELKGLKDKAIFKFNGTPETVGSWETLEASAADIKYVYTAPDTPVTVAPTTDNKDLSTPFETVNNALFMLMPQALSDVTLDITYSAAPTLHPNEYTFNSTKTVKLTGEWGIGKNIRYTLKLTSDASAVTFSPTVNGWSDGIGTTEPVTPPAE